MNKFAFILILAAVGSSCFGAPQEAATTSAPANGTVGQHILGGQPITIDQRPYQVSIKIHDNSFCGGFIISEQYILTAAHCVRWADISSITVRGGSTFRSQGDIIPITEKIVHPEFNTPQNDKDVALLKTAEKLVFSEKLKAVRLPSEGRAVIADTKVVVTGWGRIKEGSSTLPEQLMSVELPVVQHSQCAQTYPDQLTYNEFCAGNFFMGDIGACNGDFGSPATQEGVAVGIASYGRGCGRPEAPSVFTDIAAKPVRSFIKEKTGL